MERVPLRTQTLSRFRRLIGPRESTRVHDALRAARAALDGRRIWHVNSTRLGGGVAEMLNTLLGYERGAGIAVGWLVIDGDAPFFGLTKRIHNHLHGRNGDGRGFTASNHRTYARVMRRNLDALLGTVRAGDVVVLHDPQTAGLAAPLRRAGATVIWRCHVGSDRPNEAVAAAWGFLAPYLDAAHAHIFSRDCYVPDALGGARVAIIPPAIDAFSLKNAPLSRRRARAVLRHIGVLAPRPWAGDLRFRRADGSWARVVRRADIVQTAPVPDVRTPIVLQVSRWDPLKDMAGVMRAFAAQSSLLGDAHLVLAGPDVSGVTDDPEGAGILRDCIARWSTLPRALRARVHLVSLPMADLEENAVMVNALQRHATVVVQKSLQEGFGLTVTEAMWKRRPVIASAVGGIQDQIADGVHGVLLGTPGDATGFGAAAARLLSDRATARRLGRNARRRAAAHYLGPTQSRRTLELVSALLAHP